MCTGALLTLALAIAPQFLLANSSSVQSASDPLQGLLRTLLNLWFVDLVVIAVSVEHISLTISTIPFMCIFPTLLVISFGDFGTFARIVLLAALTISFIIARYVGNSI